jgi:predicted DNA-binding transcriptional regulator AlpA
MQMLTEPLIDAGTVAQLLGITRSRFIRNRDRLVREAGFPQSVNNLHRWDPQAIARWVARQSGEAMSFGGVAERASATQADASADEVAAWQAELDARAAGLGRVA